MAFPTTGIIDDFNRANEGPPPSSSWTNVENGGLKVVSNTVQGASTSSGGYRSNWNDSIGPDCEAYATTISDPASFNLHARLTDHSMSADGYTVYYYNNEVIINRQDNGATTQLGSAISSGNFDPNDRLGIEIIGDQISAYYDIGAGWVLGGTRTDDTYSEAGYLGLRTYHSGGVRILDDFGGGTISTGTTIEVGKQDLTLSVKSETISIGTIRQVSKQDLAVVVNTISVAASSDASPAVSKQDLNLQLSAGTILASRTWVWGHDTSVDEQATGDLADGTYDGALSGSGDSEKVQLEPGEYWQSPTKFIGLGTFKIAPNKYQGGTADGFTVKYKTGITEAACDEQGWSTGTTFVSSGWAKLRVEY